MRRQLVALVATALLAGCGGDDQAASSPSPSPSALSGAAGFMAAIAASGFGNKDTSDPGWLDIGKKRCTDITDGVAYDLQVEALVRSDAEPTKAQAEAFIRAAVTHLCPEHAAYLP